MLLLYWCDHVLGSLGYAELDHCLCLDLDCVELAGEEPDTPVEETVLAEHPKLQDCAIRGIMLRDEVSDQFAENGAPKVPPAPWRPS